MRVAYLGTSDFAAAVLRGLARTEHRPVLVVTPPDSRRGRGRRTSPAPVAEAAAELGLELLKTESTEEPQSLARIRAVEAEVGVVCAFGQILRAPLLDELELLNVHPSLLPRWRGAAPIERAIMAGDRETGVSIMRVTEGLDSGPVALREAVEIGSSDFGELAATLERVGTRLLIEALDARQRDGLELVEQDESQVTYADKITSAERLLDPGRPAIELERRVRALSPHVVAQLELAGGERLGILEATAEDGELAQGQLAGDSDTGLMLGCSAGVLALGRIRPPGGKAMESRDYLRGHTLPSTA